MGQGQFRINEDTVKRINEIDDAIVRILQTREKEKTKSTGQRLQKWYRR
jgi:hypothetical protein